MLIYIAGKLCEKEERQILEKVDKICKKEGFDTFLPHRDCGLVAFKEEVDKAFNDDAKALDECDFVVSVLNGRIGAGTAWEIGYAYCLGKKVLGVKTDKKPLEAISELSAMLLGSVEIVGSCEKLREKLKNMKNQ